jgi:hypothetical protein
VVAGVGLAERGGVFREQPDVFVDFEEVLGRQVARAQPGYGVHISLAAGVGAGTGQADQPFFGECRCLRASIPPHGRLRPPWCTTGCG